jgi:phage regulator Rha-like protein
MNIKLNIQLMSSREIAKATSKQHKTVMRDIRTMLEDMDEGTDLYLDQYSSNGRKYPEYRLPKNYVLTLVTGYSAKLRRCVIDRWQELEEKEQSRLRANNSRDSARIEAPFMTDALKFEREEIGKETKPFHYSNEYDMINRIVLGMSSKQYKQAHGLEKDSNIRDFMTEVEIMAVEHLQRSNTGMIELGVDYNKRKSALQRVFDTRYAVKMLDEIRRLEH